ncbi:MAG: DUF2892 domain-containing protein [Clostridia bacterium]|nr:DUF2892 domain-containing protein [Clostridia bacterium]MDQ7791066.1 DUF2892 domain-containing protein [Clostridia bacterium]
MRFRLDFKRNIGLRDQAIRVPAGLILLVVAVEFGGTLHPVWLTLIILLGFFQLGTAVTRYCIVFDLFGWSSYSDGDRAKTGAS